MEELPILSIEGSSQAEGQYVTFTVRLSEPATNAVTVDYRTLNGTATVGSDVADINASDPLSHTLTFAAGEQVKTISLYVGPESIDELDESLFVELSNPVGASFGGGNQSVVATGFVLDDDGPSNNRTLAVSSPTVVEGAGNLATFTISLSQPFTTPTTFTYATYDGSARSGTDYVAKAGSVTFAAGQTEALVTVSLVDDGVVEAGESFGLKVTGASGVTGAAGEAAVLNEDGTVPILSIEGSSQAEGQYVTFTVRLSEPATNAVTVDYRTLNGTATVGSDVADINASDPLSHTLTFAAGEQVKTISLYVGPESIDELDESLFVELSNPVGASFGGGNQSVVATGFVLDDDGPSNNRTLAVSSPTVVEGAGNLATFTISLSQPFTTPTTFTYATYDGSARSGTDYVAKAGSVTFAAGQTEALVTVSLVDDGVVEAGESFGLKVTGASGVTGAAGEAAVLNEDGTVPILSIEGSSQAEGQYVTFTVRLSEPATNAVTVDYRTLNGTATVGSDVADINASDPLSHTLTFAAGEQVKTISLYVGPESIDELDESLFVELSNPVGASFGGGNQSVVATGFVLDDDGPSNNRTLAVSSPTVVEVPGAVAVFAVELSQPSTSAVTLTYQTIGQTAASGADFVASTGQITFAPGQTRVEIRVPIQADVGVEAAETFQLQIVPPYPSQIAGIVATGRATIFDYAIRGTTGNDVRIGTSFPDRIEGLAGNDTLDGGSGNDSLFGGDGNDTLVGGLGNDRMDGGAGNDLFGVDAVGDVVVEPANGGIDQVNAAVSWTLGANVENLILIGTAPVNGTGNGLANRLTGNAAANALSGLLGNDTLSGGGGNDYLDGGAGNDRLEGGLGNDVLVVDAAGDVVVELANGGIDQVNAAVSWTLGAELENLVLIGTAAINGTGNTLANRLTGNSAANALSGAAGNDTLLGGLGNDTLSGGAGIDQLTGGAGNDAFQFVSASEGGDVVSDFRNLTGDNDFFRISAAGFGGGLTAGAALSASRFQSRADNLAQDADDRFIFRTTDKTLWFDSNGNVSGGLTLIADLDASATMTSADIFLV